LNRLVSTTPAEMKTKFRNVPGKERTIEKKTCIPIPLYPDTMMTAVGACRRTSGSWAAAVVGGGRCSSSSSRRRICRAAYR